ncbi:glycosyltransferase family 4 protein [Yersinia pekkanenii]|uniref:Glycosyltransferase n=1 Tax=Yersinia pekkanenii TaxID=1288385 RepID=A0A0T9NVD3_9GAMM|nr:glycosyltransferase family 4 protein [Yersinia pekkanenii]CNH32280.1 putative glycosyltransferase [Yersinia pekkanenii]CRY63005.1 putative glycosyltransferase [Yersinia pekkanenii]
MNGNTLPVHKGHNLKVGIIHLATEGIQLFVGGVGSYIRGQIQALPEVIDLLANHNIQLEPHFIEIACSKYNVFFDSHCRANYIDQIHHMGGSFSTVPDMTQGKGADCSWPYGDAFLGNLQNWQISSAAGAAKIIDISANYDITLAFCHELPFSFTPLIASLHAKIEAVNLKVIYISHGTAFNHEMPLPNPERLMAESLPIHWAKIDSTIKLGNISHFLATHLVAQYGAEPQTFIPVPAGININDPWFRIRSDQEISDTLRSHGISLEHPLAITLGRGVYYKRHDLLLKAARYLDDDIYLVVVSDPVLPELSVLASQLNRPTLIINSFDRELMACLIQWRNTRVCVLSAENEPNGLIPMESRWLARKKGALLVVADSGGLSEQVEHGVDGFLHIPGNAVSLAEVIRRVCQLSEVEIDKVRQAGATLIKTRYNWKNQILSPLGCLVPQIAGLS